MLVEKYKRSEHATKARARIQQLSTIEGNEVETRSGSQAGWWKQLTTLTRRSFVNMHRDLGYYWLRLMVYIVVSICVGTIYFDVGTGYNAILARASAGGFVTGFMTFMSIGGFPCFIEEMKVFSRERLNGHYGVGVYILSNSISSFPFLVVISACTGCITYYMVKFNTELSHCLYYCCNLFLCIAITESTMMLVAAFVPNFFMGVTIGAGIIGIMMLTSGYFRLLPDLPKPFWRYPLSYISEASWAIQGEYKNDILGLEFDPLMYGDPKLKRRDVLKNMLGISLGHSKWWDLFGLLLILLSYRFGFFVVLKFREKVLPLFRSFIHKRTLRHLDERKKPSFPSKRHPAPPHSLSSQEGLSSPIP